MRCKAGMLGANLLQPWDITDSRLVATLDISSQEQFPNGVFVHPDGAYLYVSGVGSDSVLKFAMQTAWDLSTAVYDSAFSVANDESVIRAVAFKPDGTVMYIVGSSSDEVIQYGLSTAWDITSATQTSSISVAGQETFPFGLAFSGDGSKMFIVGIETPASINEYALSVPWSVSSASHSDSVAIDQFEEYANGLAFSDDGKIVFVAGTERTTLGQGNDVITALDLPAPWSIASVSLRQTYELASPAATPHDIAFKSDGTEMYLADLGSSSILQYSIG